VTIPQIQSPPRKAQLLISQVEVVIPGFKLLLQLALFYLQLIEVELKQFTPLVKAFVCVLSKRAIASPLLFNGC